MRTIVKTLAATAALCALGPVQTALAKVSAKPDASGLPGSNQLEQLVNGLFFWALLASLACDVRRPGRWRAASSDGVVDSVGDDVDEVAVRRGWFGLLVIGAAEPAGGLRTMLPAAQRPGLAQRDGVDPAIRVVARDVDVGAAQQLLPRVGASVVDEHRVKATGPGGDRAPKLFGLAGVELGDLIAAG
jgi:hypothetical protein